MQFEDFGLVLKDIEPHLSEPVFNYFISIMLSDSNNEEQKVQDQIETTKALNTPVLDKRSSTSTLQFRSKPNIKERIISSKASGKTKSTSGSLWYPAKERPIRTAESGPERDILCSKLPVCRNIVSKVQLKETEMGISETSSEISENDSLIGDTGAVKAARTQYKNIVGKIVETDLAPDILPKQEKFMSKKPNSNAAAKVKSTGKKIGVCNYSQAVSNPLYKSYHPEGYIKSDDEIAKDFIFSFVEEFNNWLAGIEGDVVRLDPEIIFKIMRKDLETDE